MYGMTPMGVFFPAIFPLEINEQAFCQQPQIVPKYQPVMKPRRELFSSSSLASSHPASAGRPKGEMANAIRSPAIPVEMSFLLCLR